MLSLFLTLGLILLQLGAIGSNVSAGAVHSGVEVGSIPVFPERRLSNDGPLEIGNQRQLFIDDYVIESMEGLSRVFHSPERHPGNPIIVGDQPWEQWVIEVNGRAVVYDDKAHEFRMYYLAPEMDPAAPYGERFRACLATSRDGINWERPNLGQLEWKGSRQNNLLRYGENWMRRPNVILDTADPEPARRYKTMSTSSMVGPRSLRRSQRMELTGDSMSMGSRGSGSATVQTCSVGTLESGSTFSFRACKVGPMLSEGQQVRI